MKPLIIETDEITIITNSVLDVKLNRDDSSVSITYMIDEDEAECKYISCSSEKKAKELYANIVKQIKAHYGKKPPIRWNDIANKEKL